MTDVCGDERYCDRKNRIDWGFYFYTLHGDGEYPVFAEFDEDGNITKLMVDLDAGPWEDPTECRGSPPYGGLPRFFGRGVV